MENSIIRGQPWTIRLRLKPEQIVVGNIQGIYLAVVQGANKTVKIFADGVSNWTLNSSQNTVTCQLSAANTNTLTAGIRAGISAHITDTSGEKSEVFAGIFAVENQGSTDVLPDILDANIQSGQTIPDSEIDADLRPVTFTSNGSYTPSGFDGYSQVTVNVGAPSGTKQITITENGTVTENVANYANAAITTNVVNQDYLDALTALGVTEDLTDSIEALTAYANGVTGESDTTLSDAVASLADGYGQGGEGGLVYEDGTYTPATDELPTISFANSHSKAPDIIVFVDASATASATGNTLTSFTYMNVSAMFGNPLPYNGSTSWAVFYAYTRIASNLNGASGAAAYTRGNVAANGFEPFAGTTSFICRQGQTYKWIAIWK